MSRNTQRSRNLSGFTLIELLVVIAIIAILAAILFPVFAQARESARAISCLSNFKQTNLGVQMYIQDYDETFPDVDSVGFAGPNYVTYPFDQAWPSVVQPYMKNWQILRCPDDPNANNAGLSVDPNTNASDLGASQDKQNWDWSFRADLGYNYNWLAYNASPCSSTGPFKVATEASVTRPAHTILFVDSIWGLNGSTPSGGGNWAVDSPVGPPDLGCYLGGWNVNASPTVWNQYGGSWPWHKSHTTFNVGYIDGHVKAQNLGQLMAGADPTKYIIYDADAYQWSTN